jgi:hypothetical protein
MEMGGVRGRDYCAVSWNRIAKNKRRIKLTKYDVIIELPSRALVVAREWGWDLVKRLELPLGG